MSKGITAFLAAGVVGAVAWALTKQANQRVEFQVPIAPRKLKTNDTRNAIFGGLFDAVFEFADNADFGGSTPGIMPAKGAPITAPPRLDIPRETDTSRVDGLGGLFDTIGNVEAPKGYDQVYGGIRASDRPKRPITTMTVGEVLAWQESIDHKYNSEAAGRYQIMEDTLAGLVSEGHVSLGTKFNKRTQDRLAEVLANRRGLSKYRKGQITAEEFAHNLSKEWASLPAIFSDKRGRKATGQSYYAGDGLNRSHVSINSILDAVRGI